MQTTNKYPTALLGRIEATPIQPETGCVSRPANRLRAPFAAPGPDVIGTGSDTRDRIVHQGNLVGDPRARHPMLLLRFSIGLREAAGASPAIAVVRFEPSSVQYLVMTVLDLVTAALTFPFRLRRRHQFCCFTIRDRQSNFKRIANRHSRRERPYERVSGSVSACDGDLDA
jgi:hypothetical protein